MDAIEVRVEDDEETDDEKRRIKISRTGTPIGEAYGDIRSMIFDDLSTNRIKDILRKEYKFDENEITKAIKEMKIISEGRKFGFIK